MTVSVGAKLRKNPPVPVQAAPEIGPSFEQVLLELESVCARILESRFADSKEYSERLYLQQHFKNIVTPVSLALAECKGPQRFHYHYRHSNGNADMLEPAANPPPLDTLGHVCADALKQCQKKLSGVHDADLIESQRSLEHALRSFLLRYRHLKIKEKEAESA